MSNSLVRYAISPRVVLMDCPQCNADMVDVTDSWHTFIEAEGAEYLASYVTIWHCPKCTTVAGGTGDRIEWVIEQGELIAEE